MNELKGGPFARNGSTNGRTKLNDETVCVIRSMHKIWGLSVVQIAERWSMPKETVRDIIKRRTWRHI